jgi:hypothetical protein
MTIKETHSAFKLFSSHIRKVLHGSRILNLVLPRSQRMEEEWSQNNKIRLRCAKGRQCPPRRMEGRTLAEEGPRPNSPGTLKVVTVPSYSCSIPRLAVGARRHSHEWKRRYCTPNRLRRQTQFNVIPACIGTPRNILIQYGTERIVPASPSARIEIP